MFRYRENRHLTGTPRYASVNNHLGIEQSRRDDLESLAYILIYFIRGGNLPWQGLPARTKAEKYRVIMQKKMGTPIDVLCKGYPDDLKVFLEYCRGVGFADKPDYAYLRRLLKELALRHNIENDGQFDWIVQTRERAAAKTRASASAMATASALASASAAASVEPP